MIENLGDAYEALEECYHLINVLSGGSKTKIFEAYKEYSKKNHPGFDSEETEENFWDDDY